MGIDKLEQTFYYSAKEFRNVWEKGTKMIADKIGLRETQDERDELIRLILSLSEDEIAEVIRRAQELPGLQ